MPENSSVEIIIANEAADFEIAKQLFIEYQQYLGEDLCFQSFNEELMQLSSMYGAPGGLLLLAKNGHEYIGCVALRNKGAKTCEMKRLYVKEDFKGMGAGRKLTNLVIDKAREMGYEKMILDTLSRLKPALALYHKVGFTETAAYYANPLKDVIYLELKLT